MVTGTTASHSLPTPKREGMQKRMQIDVALCQIDCDEDPYVTKLRAQVGESRRNCTFQVTREEKGNKVRLSFLYIVTQSHSYRPD